jgi:Zn-dependent protease
VPQFVVNLIFVIREFLTIPFDLVRGIRRRRYRLSYDVGAPKDVTWSVVSARKITLIGTPPIELDTEADPERPGVYSGFCRTPQQSYSFAYRILDERPGEALSISILHDESDPIYAFGGDYVGSVAVAGNSERSTVTGSCDLTHTRFASRLIMPLALARSSSRIKRTAEHKAGAPATPGTGEQVKNAALTGVLTFASFFALFGPSVAAMLVFLILLHELGHVIGMRWAGIPVKGIYFVPFFGGVAIGEGAAKSEAARGLVALMGPGASIVTTALFAMLARQDGSGVMRQLVLMSALLNGFNLLPILPLDGGHIVQSLLSRAGSEVARTFRVIALFSGCTLAFWIGDYLLLTLLAVLAPTLISRRMDDASRLPPLTAPELLLLTAAYAATIIFYALTIGQFWGASSAS